MPTPAKSWIVQLWRQKQAMDVLDQLDPVETLPVVELAPLAVGPGPLVGTGSTLGAHPNHVRLLRPVVRLFQLRAMLGLQGLRRQIAAPTPNLPPSPLWITRFTTQHYIPRETPQNLRNMVGAPTGHTRKHKRSTSHDQLVTDVETWLHEAHQANDQEAVCNGSHAPSSTSKQPQHNNKSGLGHSMCCTTAGPPR